MQIVSRYLQAQSRSAGLKSSAFSFAVVAASIGLGLSIAMPARADVVETGKMTTLMEPQVGDGSYYTNDECGSSSHTSGGIETQPGYKTDSDGVNMVTQHTFKSNDGNDLPGDYFYQITATIYGNIACSGNSSASAGSSFAGGTITNGQNDAMSDARSITIPPPMIWNDFYTHDDVVYSPKRTLAAYELANGFSIFVGYKASSSTRTYSGGSATGISNSHGSVDPPFRIPDPPPGGGGGGVVSVGSDKLVAGKC